MYGLCYATLIGQTVEEVERKVDEYRKYPHFDGGTVRETVGKFKLQGRFMAIVNYFNND